MENAKSAALPPAKAALMGLLFAILFLVATGIAVAASYDNDGGSYGDDVVQTEDDADHSETDSDADPSESDEEHSE